MTDNEIKKGLECCLTPHSSCWDCPYKDVYHRNITCEEQLGVDTVSLIKRQQVEISELEIELQAMRGAANSYKAEVESLNNEVDKLLKRIPAADAVEVVRCSGCRFYRTDTLYCKETNKGYCEFDGIVKPKNHFCGYGERKGDNND